MRTTLVIDNHVFAEAKRRALDTGLSLSEFTTMALREALRKRETHARRSSFAIPTYGAGAPQSSSPEAIAALRDEGR